MGEASDGRGGFQRRPFCGEEDVRRMIDLVVAMRAQGGHGCWHTGDVTWRLLHLAMRHAPEETVWLWEDREGKPAGFAVVVPARAEEGAARGRLRFDLQVHPRWRGGGLEEEIVRWVEVAAGEEVGLATDTGVYEDDRSQAAVLEQHGFERAGGDEVLVMRRLSEPAPAAVAPEGFVVRAMVGAEEVGERVAAHREAFHPSRMTEAAYGRLMEAPGYEAGLDLVAAAPDGRVAAFCNGWLDRANGVGEFEPVGTRPAYQRRGLARAVLLEGLRRMRAAGAEACVVGPIGRGEAAFRLYEAAGFRPHLALRSYGREPGGGKCTSVP